MRILYLNGADIEGGAAKAATRLLQGVHAHGVDARLYVQREKGTDPLINGPTSLFGKVSSLIRPTIEQLLLGINSRNMTDPFCAAYLPDGLARKASDSAPDLIHLHWVARMMRLETLTRFAAPLVWTMHDSWAFTGGCYLPGTCNRYRESCGTCPVLGSDQENDLSRRVWQRKEKAWHGLNLTIIAPSRWMAACARASSLFYNSRIEVIPNGIDVQSYKPVDKHAAREQFSLPHDRKLILFGARSATEDRNKGFHLLSEALRELSNSTRREMFELVVFGTAKSDQLAGLGLKVHYLGWQHDDTSLSHIYSANDVMVLPSLQENLPYVVMEAMACGLPCVAFNQGGVPDLIDHQQNGYLAKPYEPADLARGVGWVLEIEERRRELAAQARHKVVRDFALEIIVGQHLALYRKIHPASSSGKVRQLSGEGNL